MIHTSFPFVFFGTPEPAVEILDALLAKGFVPTLIVTAPDKPQGRKLVVTPPPVKVWALAHNIPFLQPQKLDSSFALQLRTYNFELFLVVAYGSLIPKEILALPKHGSLNVHYSLLPKFRGASPIEHQILEDDRDAGVSILLLDEEMDHGPIVAEQKIQDTQYKIQEWPLTSTELRKISNHVAGELLTDTLPDWVGGKIEAKPQDHSKATYTRKFKKTDGELDMSSDAYKNFLKIKAFEGSIGTYFFVSSHSPFSKGSGEPISRGISKSSVLADSLEKTRDKSDTSFMKGGTGKKIRVGIKDAKMEGDKLVITRVVPEGKKEMDYAEFLRGFRQ